LSWRAVREFYRVADTLDGIREIGVIWSAEFWRTMRSARVVVLLVLYVMFTGLALLVVNGFAQGLQTQMDQMEEQVRSRGASDEEIAEAKTKARRQFISTFFSNDEEMTEALAAIPLVLLIVFKASLRFLPLFTGVMGFDQISGEVGPRSIRYLAVRSRRSSVLFGKFLAQLTLLAALALVVNLALVVFGLATNTDFGAGAMFGTLGRFWLSAMVLSLAYLALTTLCSSLFRQPAVSLVMNLIALFAIWVVALVGEFAPLAGDKDMMGRVTETTSPLAYLRFLSVWHYSPDLLHPVFSRWGVAALAHLGFAALFLGAAYLVVRERDL
jgi:ABC-type transport system involved in multi-copper enzyme maturation permease subunit